MAHPLQSFVSEGLIDHCNQIATTVFPEKIYLLGFRKHVFENRNCFIDVNETIDSSDCLLLVVFDPSTTDQHLLHARLKSLVTQSLSPHFFILSLKDFQNMCSQGHPFTHTVMKDALLCYDSKQSSFHQIPELQLHSFSNEILDKIIRAQESLNFANDAMSRSDLRQAAINLHQSGLHSLSAIIHHFTGLDYHSKNIEELFAITVFFLPLYTSTDKDFLPAVRQLQNISENARAPGVDISPQELSNLFPVLAKLLDLCLQLVK